MLIKVVVKKPNVPAYVEVITNDLRSFQQQVGGYIEVYTDHDFPDGLKAVVNEEGKMHDLAPNLWCYLQHDVLCGTVVFVLADDCSCDFTSIPDNTIDWVLEWCDKNAVEY